MTAELKPKLKRFLKEKGAYDAFMSNRENDIYPSEINEINIHFGFQCIARAFFWGTTPEGPEYWDKLAVEFDKIDTK